MAVTDVDVDERIRDELGDQLDDVLRSLFAVACQTCGQPLPGTPIALQVSNLGSFLAADLHHAACRRSAWRDHQLTWPDTHAPTSHTLGLVMPGESEGQPDPRTMLLVNPSLEQVLLSRDRGGRWVVRPNGAFKAVGLRTPSTADFSRPASDVVTSLRSSSAVVVFDPGVLGPFEFTLDSETGRLAEQHGGVVLAVTQALDPQAVRALSDLAPMMASDQALMGFVELESVRRGRPTTSGAKLGKRFVVQWDRHEIWTGELVDHQPELLSDPAAKIWAEQCLADRELLDWQPLGAAGPVGWTAWDRVSFNQFVLVCHTDGWRLAELYAHHQADVRDEGDAQAWAGGQIQHRLGLTAVAWSPGPTSIDATTLYAAV